MGVIDIPVNAKKLKALGGQGSAYIAAVDSPQSWKDVATVVCDGVNDQAEINQYINSVPVILAPGTFSIAGTINVSIENPSLKGQGWNSKLKSINGFNNYVIVFAPPGNGVRGTFRDFTIDGNGSNQTAGGGIHAIGAVQSIFENIWFTNCWDNGLWLDSFLGSGTGAFGHHNKVKHCLFDNTLAFAGISRGMLLQGNDENTIESEFQYLGGTNTVTFAVRDLAGLNKYRNSVFVGGRNNMGGIELRDGKRGSVIGCQFDGVSGDNIFIASSGQHIIAQNTFTSVADQAVTAGAYTGVHFEFGAVENVFTNNILDNSATNGQTHSLIRERNLGGTGYNFINFNTIHPRGTLASTATVFEPTTSTTTPNYVNLVKV